MRFGHAVLASALAYAGAMAVTSCSGPQPPPFKPLVDVKALMNSVVDPQAEVIWGSVATIITMAGTEERQPHRPTKPMATRN